MSGAAQALVTDTGDAERLIKGLADAIPLGSHPEPWAKWIEVRLDFVQQAIDHIEWLEKSNEEWRDMAVCAGKQSAASRATARIAIEHLQAVVQTGPVPVEDFNARCRALDWLTSIRSEPT